MLHTKAARKYRKLIRYEFAEGNATLDDLVVAEAGYAHMRTANILPSIQRNFYSVNCTRYRK